MNCYWQLKYLYKLLLRPRETFHLLFKLRQLCQLLLITETCLRFILSNQDVSMLYELRRVYELLITNKNSLKIFINH